MSKDYRCKNHRVMSITEEYDLFEEYAKTKSDKIRDTIIEHNLRFAMGCAIAYSRKYTRVNLNDLKSYAVMGLIEGFDNFDHTRGIKFTSYASWWVKCSINRNVEQHESLIRYPSNIHREMYDYYTKKKVDGDSNNLEDRYSVITSNVSGGISIDQPIEDTDLKLEDTISSGQDIENEYCVSESVKNALNALTPIQRHVIEGMFGFNDGDKRTVRDLAAELNISHENVRYIKNKALEKLTKCYNNGLI